jgi:hypothetical protein
MEGMLAAEDLKRKLPLPQPFSAGDQRHQHKSNRDPGKCRLIRGKSDGKENKSKNEEDRRGNLARSLFFHFVIIHKVYRCGETEKF